MQSLKNRIEDLIGATANHANIDDLALKDFLEASAKDVIDKLPSEVLLPYGANETTSSRVLDILNKRILGVHAANVIALEKSILLEGNITQAGSNHLATTVSPAYIKFPNGQLKIYPADNEATVYTYPYPSVDISQTYIGSSASDFPETAHYAVILCAAMKCMQSIINDLIHTEEDVELVQATQLELTSLQNLYQMEMQRFGV